jgi:predicted transposase/invertase (TIGR01784 family)
MIIDVCPTVDFAFKLMLGSPEHTAVTVHFLNAVLDSGPRITQATILNPFLGKETADDKLSVLDIKARDELGRYLNIEMQTSAATGLRQRLAYYAGRLYVDQMREGMDYISLCPAISICVLTQAIFPRVPALHLDFRLREKRGLTLAEELQVHLVELPKSQATPHNISTVSPLERWAFLLLYADHIDTDELRDLLPDPEFHDALGVLEMITQTPETRELYEARLKAKRDEEARLAYARSEGLAEGRTEGEKIGLTRGEQLGLVRGEKIGQIRLLERMLHRSPTPDAELAEASLEDLAQKLESLEQLSQRPGAGG